MPKASSKKSAARGKPAVKKKSPAKKPAAKRTAAKKSAAKKPAAKLGKPKKPARAAAKRPRVKAPAKRTAAKKSAAKELAKRRAAKQPGRTSSTKKAAKQVATKPSAIRASAKPPLPKRNVPATAEWFPEWKQWGAGARDAEGKRTGPWKYWRTDGSLQEESPYEADLVHGEARRYHPNGELAALQRHERGVMRENLVYRIRGKTDEQTFDLPEAIHSCRFLMDETGQWQTSVAFFNAEGVRLSYAGEPLPPWPAGVPADAYPNDDLSAFCTGLFNHGKFLGIHRTWFLDGRPRSLTYINGSHFGVLSRDPMPHRGHHPLIAASEAGDAAALDEMLNPSAGNEGFPVGNEPGLVLEALLEGQAALALRLAALPEIAGFAAPDEASGHAAPAPERPAEVAEGARYLAGRRRWMWASEAAAGELPAEAKAWGVDGDSGEVDELEIHRFEGGVRRQRLSYDGPESDRRLREEEIFDERGASVRERSYEYDDSFREREALPSGEKIRRWGRAGKTLGEKRYDANGALRIVSAFFAQSEGRVCMELDVAAGVGTAFDAHGQLAASGPVRPAAAGDLDAEDGYDDDDDREPGQLTGTWTLANGAKVNVDGFSLEASERTAQLLPLLVRLTGAPPPIVASAKAVPWKKLEGFFPLDPARIPQLFWLISLDEPAAVSFGLDALSDAIYHQETISELSGPVGRLLLELAAHSRHPESVSLLVELLSAMLTRGYTLDSAHELKKAYRLRKSDSPKDLAQAFERRHQEASYGEMFHALQAQRAAISRWIKLPLRETANRALYLLGLIEGREAAEELAELVRNEAAEDPATGDSDDNTLASGAAHVMSLFPREELPLDVLRAAMSDEQSPRALEAALTLIRVGAEDERAVAIAMKALREGSEDAGIALTLLPNASEHIGELLSLLREAPLADVYGLARAALILAMAEAEHEAESEEGEDDLDDDATDDDSDGGDDDATDDDATDDDATDDSSDGYDSRADDDQPAPLPPILRDVLQAIASSDSFWRLSVNAAEVLSDFELPSSRAALVALLTGAPQEEDDDEILSAASGLGGISVDSWRDVPR